MSSWECCFPLLFFGIAVNTGSTNAWHGEVFILWKSPVPGGFWWSALIGGLGRGLLLWLDDFSPNCDPTYLPRNPPFELVVILSRFVYSHFSQIRCGGFESGLLLWLKLAIGLLTHLAILHLHSNTYALWSKYLSCAALGTVAILAQGTSWAVAVTQAFFMPGSMTGIVARRSFKKIASR